MRLVATFLWNNFAILDERQINFYATVALFVWKREHSLWNTRVASGPGTSGNLEKSGNFVALEKKVREFREIRKSQGILTRNWEKSGNFTCAKRISPKLFQNSLKWWTRISHACSYITHAHGFLSKNKNEFKLWNNLFFFLFGSESGQKLIKLYYICRDEIFQF